MRDGLVFVAFLIGGMSLAFLLGLWGGMRGCDSAKVAKRDASLCSQAVMGSVYSAATMNTRSMTEDQAWYWTRYKIGADQIVEANCGG